jgi:hypothetical protein
VRLGRRRRAREPGEIDRLLAAAGADVDRVASAGEPVIAGPWLGEVGYELLYWVPFLTWAVERRPELAERLHVVSRGGAEPWYAHLTSRYEDVYAQLDPAEIAERRGKRSKQVERTPLEAELVADSARRFGLDRWTELHPAALYSAILGLTKLDATPAIRGITRHRTLVAPPTAGLALPERYTAVRFYFSAPFPHAPENREFAREAVRALAARGTVVVLNTGLRIDDHMDAEAPASERVVTIDRDLDAATNLAVQTAVVARASTFVGTYGGLSYLAPLHGVPAIAFYSHGDRFLRRHLELAHGVFAELDVPYVTLPTAAADLLGMLAELEAAAP